MGAAHAIRILVAETAAYLGRYDHPAIADICTLLEGFVTRPVNIVTPQPVPACGWLDESIAAIEGADDLRDAIMLSRPWLNWGTYDSYEPGTIGPHFPNSHAFASVIGSGGAIHAEDWDFGLFLIAPHILYRDHHHQAPELYAPLTGPHRWRFGLDKSWVEKPAHVPVWNEPWAVHATLTGDEPFLCLFVWTRDVDIPAKVVPAQDWLALESPK